jgi:hypothetical protein
MPKFGSCLTHNASDAHTRVHLALASYLRVLELAQACKRHSRNSTVMLASWRDMDHYNIDEVRPWIIAMDLGSRSRATWVICNTGQTKHDTLNLLFGCNLWDQSVRFLHVFVLRGFPLDACACVCVRVRATLRASVRNQTCVHVIARLQQH